MHKHISPSHNRKTHKEASCATNSIVTTTANATKITIEPFSNSNCNHSNDITKKEHLTNAPSAPTTTTTTKHSKKNSDDNDTCIVLPTKKASLYSTTQQHKNHYHHLHHHRHHHQHH